MEQSSSSDYDELTVMHQFDRKCKLAMDGEVANYKKHMAYLQEHEIMFSELSEKVTDCFFTTDEYDLEKYYFKAGGV